MEHAKTGIVVLAIALTSALSALSVYWFEASETFLWQVRPGLTMNYSVRVTGYSKVFSPDGIMNGPPPYSYLNNSWISMNITSLPNLDDSPDGYSFQLQVIDVLKTQQIGPLRYANGTHLFDPNLDFLNTAVSMCILPIGAWNRLDSFYPDEPESEYACDTYLSRMGRDRFMIGHRLFHTDAGVGWYGMVSMDNGVPNSVVVWESKFYGDVWFSYSILLDLFV